MHSTMQTEARHLQVFETFVDSNIRHEKLETLLKIPILKHGWKQMFLYV